jgi:hypothetical protein
LIDRLLTDGDGPTFCLRNKEWTISTCLLLANIFRLEKLLKAKLIRNYLWGVNICIDWEDKVDAYCAPDLGVRRTKSSLKRHQSLINAFLALAKSYRLELVPFDRLLYLLSHKSPENGLAIACKVERIIAFYDPAAFSKHSRSVRSCNYIAKHPLSCLRHKRKSEISFKSQLKCRKRNCFAPKLSYCWNEPKISFVYARIYLIKTPLSRLEFSLFVHFVT